MDRGPVQSVLRCEQCNKPFDKQATLKRHGYYCRSRRGQSRDIRARSCLPCARGKVRCDNTVPRCSRCKIKKFECTYPSKPTHRVGPAPQEAGDVPQGSRALITPAFLESTPPITEGLRPENIGPDTDCIDLGASWEPDLVNLGDNIEWDIPNFDVSNPLESSSSSIQDLAYPLDYAAEMEPLDIMTSLSTPVLPAPKIRSLFQRPNIRRADTTANFMKQILNSYPIMLLQHETLPPFIHPQCVALSNEGDIEPLTNCLNLMRMISNRDIGSKKLFWKMARSECERFRVEHETFNGWQLLATLQAITIYTLVRLAEGETENNNLDLLLLSTMKFVFASLVKEVRKNNECQASDGVETGISWRDWIFVESSKRVAVVLTIMSLLVTVEPAVLCDMPAAIILPTLPARKQLWEAGHETEWRSNYRRDPDRCGNYALASNGMLLQIDERLALATGTTSSRLLANSSKSPTNWEKWCSGMDGLGTLIMFAASLLS